MKPRVQLNREGQVSPSYPPSCLPPGNPKMTHPPPEVILRPSITLFFFLQFRMPLIRPSGWWGCPTDRQTDRQIFSWGHHSPLHPERAGALQQVVNLKALVYKGFQVGKRRDFGRETRLCPCPCPGKCLGVCSGLCKGQSLGGHPAPHPCPSPQKTPGRAFPPAGSSGPGKGEGEEMAWTGLELDSTWSRGGGASCRAKWGFVP